LFTDADRAGALPVAIVNDSMARRFWPQGRALGARLKKGGPQSATPWLTIVGIVGDVRVHGQAAAAAPGIYFPSGQHEGLGISPGEMAVRTTGDPLHLVPTIQKQIWALDKEQPVTSVRTMGEIVSASVAQRRFNTLILVLFASLAVVLAVVGIYGVVSYAANQRTAEMGIRIALGAQRSQLTRLVIGRVVGMVGIGIAIGGVAAYVVTRFMATLLYGVAPHDPMTFASVATLLACVAAVAGYLPARRASRVDPMVALRHE
jgi:putative ABC transport system permease protein